MSINSESSLSKDMNTKRQDLPDDKGTSQVITVMATPAQGSDPEKISYADIKIIATGTYGVVYKARLLETGELIAIKRTVRDKHFKDRELQIMREIDHCNIVKLKYFFTSRSETTQKVHVNLVLEFIPETLRDILVRNYESKQLIPILYVKLYMYQLFRSLAYLHSLEICHRDVNPRNLLLNTETGILKLCDFGSAKHLIKEEPNLSYICSRYYRAPELIFGASRYTTKIDMWSAGCVLAEMIHGFPIFFGENGVDQLVEIIKVLGTPTRKQIKEMNQAYAVFKLPQIRSCSWQKVLGTEVSSEAIDLVSNLLVFSPSARLNPSYACTHKFFKELCKPDTKLPNNKELPPLFNLTEYELTIKPTLNSILVPPHVMKPAAQ